MLLPGDILKHSDSESQKGKGLEQYIPYKSYTKGRQYIDTIIIDKMDFKQLGKQRRSLPNNKKNDFLGK